MLPPSILKSNLAGTQSHTMWIARRYPLRRSAAAEITTDLVLAKDDLAILNGYPLTAGKSVETLVSRQARSSTSRVSSVRSARA